MLPKHAVIELCAYYREGAFLSHGVGVVGIRERKKAGCFSGGFNGREEPGSSMVPHALQHTVAVVVCKLQAAAVELAASKSGFPYFTD